jgi:hypothetical protein
MPPGKSAIVVIVFGILITAAGAPAFGQSAPLLLVADLTYTGLSDLEMMLLVDLFSYTIAETGEYLVMNRYERNKLLRGFGYSQRHLEERKVYLEAAELLRARYIVTGTCESGPTGLALALSLWDVNGGTLLATAAEKAADFKALVARVRPVTQALTGLPPSHKRAAGGAGLSASLYISPIRERILVVLPSPPLTPDLAAARLLVSEAAARFPEENRFQFYFSNAAYDPDRVDPASLEKMPATRDCHTLGLIVKNDNNYGLALYGPGLAETLRFPLSAKGERKENSRLLALKMEKDIPFPDPLLLARELEREIRIKEKLDELLFNEKFLSQRFALQVHNSIIKPALVEQYHPLLNLLSLEGDLYYYYSDFFGIGIGYAFSLGYPATLDSNLLGHPLVAQHEFRVIPLSFRSAGRASVICNLVTALNLHNGYTIGIDGATEEYTFTDEKLFVFFKLALNMGMLINLNEEISVSIDFVTLSAIFPIYTGAPAYDGTRLSGGFGGLGVIVRF